MILRTNGKGVHYILEKPHKTTEVLHKTGLHPPQLYIAVGFHKNIQLHLARR